MPHVIKSIPPPLFFFLYHSKWNGQIQVLWRCMYRVVTRRPPVPSLGQMKVCTPSVQVEWCFRMYLQAAVMDHIDHSSQKEDIRPVIKDTRLNMTKKYDQNTPHKTSTHNQWHACTPAPSWYHNPRHPPSPRQPIYK